MSKLVSIGELLIDFQSVGFATLAKTNEFKKSPGGAPANVAVQVSKLGQQAYYIAKVGNDAFGDYLIQSLKDEGVNTDSIVKDDKHSTPLAFVSFQENGEREFSFFRKTSADLYLSSDDVKEIVFEKNDIFNFGSVALSSKSSKEAHLKLIKEARGKDVIVSFDPNLRFNLWDDLNELYETVNEFLNYADIVKISDDELSFITKEESEEKSLQMIFNKGVKLILLSRGSKGATLITYKGKRFDCLGYKVKAIDTTGAGDSFFGCFLAQVLETKVSLEELLNLDLQTFLNFACKGGSYTTTNYGAISGMGNKKEILAYFKEGE